MLFVFKTLLLCRLLEYQRVNYSNYKSHYLITIPNISEHQDTKLPKHQSIRTLTSEPLSPSTTTPSYLDFKISKHQDTNAVSNHSISCRGFPNQDSPISRCRRINPIDYRTPSLTPLQIHNIHQYSTRPHISASRISETKYHCNPIEYPDHRQHSPAC